MSTDALGGISLFSFQEEAAEQMRAVALEWIAKAAAEGPPAYGTSAIPFVGQLRAVTGAGKTPILADVIAGLGSAVVLWTSKSSAVVEQTYNNLRGRYRNLLGDGRVQILRPLPGEQDWRDLVDSTAGLTIWVMTTASWNESEAAKGTGKAEARLNLHRPQQDWAGGNSSPWNQLRTSLKRPLWIVSDESHNQTPGQLDQLAELGPVGFFLASATPVQNELFHEWQKVLEREPGWRELAQRAQVPVRTADVVRAELLKSTLELVDFNSGTEESLDGALQALRRVEVAARDESVSLTPRAIYVVEKSNVKRGSSEEPRPVTIWRHLRSAGVPADEIAIYTETDPKALPADAEKVSSLSRLRPRHRHIIFNQSLQEGWDDPEAYVCYFDGTTKSFVRIRQIVGRVLRQPRARRLLSEELNSAVLVVNTPSDYYERVLEDLRAELRLYAPEDEPGSAPIRLKTRRDPLPTIPLREEFRGALTLPRWILDAPDFSEIRQELLLVGDRPWPSAALEHPGVGRKAVVSLKNESISAPSYVEVLRSARTANGVFFRRQLASLNRNALIALHTDAYMNGEAWEQTACQGSRAQADLAILATRVVEFYESRVNYGLDPDPDEETWTVGDFRPRGGPQTAFTRAAHGKYPVSSFNNDERALADALERAGRGVWVRNADAGASGYAVPLVAKAGGSLRFFPDFLWWPDGPSGACWALDTTGAHLLQEKVRGKLVALGAPHVGLIVRGRVDISRDSVDANGSWTLVKARSGASAFVQNEQSLDTLLRAVGLSSGTE